MDMIYDTVVICSFILLSTLPNTLSISHSSILVNVDDNDDDGGGSDDDDDDP